MKNKPNPNVLHPVNNRYDLIFPANLSNGKNIIIGDFTYIRGNGEGHRGEWG